MSDVLAIAEHRRGSLRDVSHQVVAAGRQVADATDGELHVAVVGGDGDAYAERLDRSGVDAIHLADVGESPSHDVFVQAVQAIQDGVEASVVIGPNSADGLDSVPAVARRLDVALVTDAIEIEAGETLTVTREMYGSKVEATVETDLPAAVTIREGEWHALEGASDAAIETVDVAIDESAVRMRVTGYQEAATGDVDITDADALVSVGRGIGEEENLQLVQDLADALGATVSASRPIVDNGWLPKNRQVGQSGKTVTPDVYVAIGISGAVQHVAGMKNAETIVAINVDPDAPIFDLADYAVVGDLFEVVPALTEAFRAAED